MSLKYKICTVLLDWNFMKRSVNFCSRLEPQTKNLKNTGVHNGMGVGDLGWLEWSKVCDWGGWVG